MRPTRSRSHEPRDAPGTTVNLDVLRNGLHTTVSVTLGTRPAT